MCERLYYGTLLLLCALIAPYLTGCGQRARNSYAHKPILLRLDTTDGATIAATLYPANGTPSCGVVLVHDKGANAAQWEDFARRLQQSGITAIAFDMRGHGDSTSPESQPSSFEEFTTRDWLQAILDIQAARNALPAHGVDPDNLAIVGAGMGANLATQYAAQDESIQALVLVSPGLEYDGVRIREAFETYTHRPSLLIATKGDTYAAASAQTLKKSASTFCELREYRGGAHGMDVIQSLVSARETVVFWLEDILKASVENTAKQGDTGEVD
ncbi:MAG: alpha/beta fold hydrolase [Candidatus Hydrogenedentota bacterium]